MKFENTDFWGFKHAFRGMRNPKESWEKSDSKSTNFTFYVGDDDLTLAQNLIESGPEHRKFLRQIFVSADITAPLYWWKEFDTYKVGTTADSTSTMHKLASTPITKDCFELGVSDEFNYCTFEFLENLRKQYLETNDKTYWRQLICWLPEGWLQTRTVTMNYENIYSMVHQRYNHKLNEWSGKDDPDSPNFIRWARTLPYADELLFWDLERT